MALKTLRDLEEVLLRIKKPCYFNVAGEKDFIVNDKKQVEYVPNSRKLIIEYIVRKEDEKIIYENINDIILYLVPKDKIFIKKQIITTIDITKGEICSSCLKDIGISPHYFCYWCNIYFCSSCGGKYNTFKQGLNRLPHFHNLILINAKKDSAAMKNIGLYKLGNNKIFKNQKEVFSQNHEIHCICCKTSINGIRYICLSCKDDLIKSSGAFIQKDFCHSCYLAMSNPLDSNFNKFNNKLCRIKHDLKTHVYLVLYYSSGGKNSRYDY